MSKKTLSPRDVFTVANAEDLYTLGLVTGRVIIVLNKGEVEEMISYLRDADPSKNSVHEVVREGFSFIKVQVRSSGLGGIRKEKLPIRVKIRSPLGLCVFRFTPQEAWEFAMLFMEASAVVSSYRVTDDYD